LFGLAGGFAGGALPESAGFEEDSFGGSWASSGGPARSKETAVRSKIVLLTLMAYTEVLPLLRFPLV
jgi:hypothetical protein